MDYRKRGVIDTSLLESKAMELSQGCNGMVNDPHQSREAPGVELVLPYFKFSAEPLIVQSLVSKFFHFVWFNTLSYRATKSPDINQVSVLRRTV